jgi:solute carrier family 26 protein
MLTSLVSALLLLSVLLYLGPYFESLPVCVLGAIIMVSLTGLLLKVRFRTANLGLVDIKYKNPY